MNRSHSEWRNSIPFTVEYANYRLTYHQLKVITSPNSHYNNVSITSITYANEVVNSS